MVQARRIINLAPTGMVPLRADSPHVPLTVPEIVADVVACAAAGATIFHIHARDDDGAPSFRRDIYARLIAGIREKVPQAIICVSLSGRHFTAFEQRADPLFLTGDLKPDMASLTLSSLNFSQSASLNSPDMIYRLAATMAERGIKPELEVFDAGMLNFAKHLIARQLLQPPYYFNLIMGGVATAQATPLQVALLMAEMPGQSVWCGGGMGRQQMDMNLLGLQFGDGARIGLEDNLWLDRDRTTHATNLQLVQRLAGLADTLGLALATPAQARARLGLESV